MINSVIKKDGEKIPFKEEKMKASIMAAASDAGVSDDEKNNIVEEVSSSVIIALEGKEEVPTSELKDKILSELDASYPEVAQAWRKYNETKSS